MSGHLQLGAGIKLETLMVCTCGTCGRCYRCTAISLTKNVVAEFLAKEMAYAAQIKGLDALAVIQREALRSLATRCEDPIFKVQIMQIVESTPAMALAALTADAAIAQTSH